ncbi:Scr1 family TA system antitoxin-like transcriptional regulator [Streptomyces sp. BE20]|uniref:Scr1 family TA system antitoxin-like transcriptional regulator n=1 Tax=Streptomyces sp. BE20 TaxID=3002525 RepID=UPI002E77F6A6|nr:Scr1 family TA system antitoxin-like transcriptional regulator [Streptomyces sp. BE20]MEE1820996.1 Scr1 family TA system antitoxin-like transcriptional regulator [Streptomyces sp. BE20]
MRVPSGPVVAGLRLAALREAANVTPQAAADAAKIAVQQLTAVEAGRAPAPPRPRLSRLLRALGADDDLPVLDALIRQTWGENTVDDQPGWAGRLESVLSQATGWRTACGAIVPVGMRTPAYQRTLTRGRTTRGDGTVFARLATTAPPVRALVLLDEQVLDRATGGPVTAAGQFDHLADLTRHNWVTVALVPAVASTGGPALTHLTTPAGPLVVEADATGARYRTGTTAQEAIALIDSVRHRAGRPQDAPAHLRTAAQWMRARSTALPEVAR